MSNSLTLYRAIRQLNELGDEKQRAAVEALASVKDVVTVTRTTVKADDEWINAVEKGLDFIGKALEEERRFIRSNGEVLPIEKIKRVSKESIQHLARHSDLVNKEITDEIIPDKLYSVERLNDYATYENRFLYMLLNMAKDFVTRKYETLSKSEAYGSVIKTNKNVSVGERRLSVNMTVSEIREAKPDEAIKRVDKLLRSIGFYLRSPIMTEVSKVDTIHSGVTLNNVLRMDKNFVEAVALYDFLLSYDKEGVIKNVETETLTGTELSRALALTSYMQIELAENFASANESELLETARREESEEFDRLKRDMPKEDAEKIIVRLIKRIQELETVSRAAQSVRARSNEQTAKISELEAELKACGNSLNEQIGRANELSIALKDAELAYSEKLKKLEADAETELKEKQREIDRANERNLLLAAQLTALRGDDAQKTTLSEEEFNELEREYEALGRLLSKEWKGVKRNLRREMLSEVKNSIFAKRQSVDQKEGIGKEEK